jgi:hypothetical protein
MSATDNDTTESLRTRLETIVQRSQLVSALTQTSESTVVFIFCRSSQWIADATTHSFLHRWLKKPEPETIVIDLRETRTVGPFITLFDAFITWMVSLWRESQLAQLTGSIVSIGEDLAETQYGQLLVQLLEPHEPPTERNDDTESDQTEVS